MVGLSVIATILLLLVTFTFWSRPERPPSASAELKAKSANDDSVKEFNWEGAPFLDPPDAAVCCRLTAHPVGRDPKFAFDRWVFAHPHSEWLRSLTE